MVHGSIVAIVTPFDDGAVDYGRLEELIEFHIESGTHGIVPVGTTGESPTLSHAEHEEVIKFTVETARGRVPVVAGTGSNSTEEALRLTKFAEKAGADAALVVTPYYNKPTQEGIYRHFRTIADKTSVPLILYNVPGRTVVNIEPETVERLFCDCENIIGIKEASGSLEHASRIIFLCGEDLILLSGDDAVNYPLLTVGGRGFISVTANIAPVDVSEMYNCFARGEIDRAKELHYRLLPLSRVLFVESNPIPVKAALAVMGKISPEIRAPLYELSGGNLERLKRELESYGLT
ncbi:MAG: 4-hydroxy-tetrahydrodipicolinate synthase [Candidatus Dadabacteria bacterium]|nr:4-hydroxy-tetrahydrodipicolinate synthase [Candidatus Dadabacteria bacterium]MDE0663218.1 4-hydroxy-tetrahydrodipicolinate synthase [Candidatus Dadabacteria bacterium]